METKPTLESKLNEFNELLIQLSSSSQIVTPLLKKYGPAARRMNNRSRNGKGIGAQLEEIHEALEPCPAAFFALADIYQRLSEVTREADALVIKNLPIPRP